MSEFKSQFLIHLTILSDGFYQIKLYKNGRWRVVTIDDFVPMKFRQIRFGKCSDKSEVWVPLLEKAFAKLNGSYEACASGHFGEGMTDLTGEGCESYNLKGIDGEAFWKRLQYFHDEAFLMGCSISPTSSSEEDNGKGLLTGHAYAVLRVATTSTGVRLVHIRNPWGCKEWSGPWSDGSREWTPALMKEMDHTDEDDGSFYMQYKDFVREFHEFCVCRLLQDEVGTVWEKRVFQGEWGAGTAGGCGNTANWTNNDQYWVRNTSPNNRVFFHLAQDDVRSKGKPKIEFSIGLYLMKHDSTMVKKETRPSNDIIHKPTFINRREYAFSIDDLEVGATYVVMACTFDPNQMAKFHLTCYSEQALEMGEMGKGTRPREAVDIFRMEDLAWLNAPGVVEVQPDSLAPPRRSPRAGGGSVSPRAGGGAGRFTLRRQRSPRANPPSKSPRRGPSEPTRKEAQSVDQQLDDIVSVLHRAPARPVGERPQPKPLRSSNQGSAALGGASASVAISKVNRGSPSSSSSASSSSSSSSASSWSVDDVARKLEYCKVSAGTVAQFRREAIDGTAFVSLTNEDLKKELALPLGDRKKIQTFRDSL